ncbi:hypothetical protein [Enterococcus faecalis]|uniref:hypothetical protein n=1 Tax=Enterococcus faecalis TaxID=1351 RepID=UPI001CD7914F|nr:hypothetical protein [Enterococcus faecalis]
MNNENEFLDWNGSFVATESEFKLFAEGDYSFRVINFERKIYDGQSTKIPNGAPFAEIELEFTDPKDGSTTKVFDRLYLLKKWQWKLTQFFASIGQAPAIGQAFSPNWNAVIGSNGKAHLVINKYTKQDGSSNENNQVKNYLETDGPVKQQQTFNQPPQQQFQQTQAPQQNFNQAQPGGFQPGAF